MAGRATTRILLLGGTGDALKIARRLGIGHVYSLAGLGTIPGDLLSAVRVGGFGGPEGLARFIEDERIGLLVDATHPYAATISGNAVAASRATGVPCWALRPRRMDAAVRGTTGAWSTDGAA